MKQISLKNGSTLVDDEDYEWLTDLRGWSNIQGYAAFCRRINGKCKYFFMHRLILLAPDKYRVDHIDGDRLNNQRSNLRLCTVQQNNQNRKKNPLRGHPLFKGVRKGSNTHTWAALVGGKFVGSSTDPHIAALFYDFWATYKYGEFANTNFKVVAHN